MIRLKELRQDMQLTQKQLAEKLGTSQQVIGYYENGINHPAPDMLIQIADFFGISVDYLLGRTDDLDNVVIKHDNPADELTTEERALVADYRSLSPALQEMVRATIATWKGTDANKSSTKPRRA